MRGMAGNSSHTPGPWKWYRANGDYLDSLWGGENESRNVLTANVECRSESDQFSFIDAYEADARLIATAPDLLDALIETEHQLTREIEGADLCDDGRHHLYPLREQVRAAIAKATAAAK